MSHLSLNQAKAVLTVLALALALFATPTFAQTRFIYSSDGSEVTDSRTGLTWRRCTEGMFWASGTCNGTPLFFTHEAALIHAQAQFGWRLPNIKELFSLVTVGGIRGGPDGRGTLWIDQAAFPLTNSGNYWSSTPDSRMPASAWAVSGIFGVADSYARSDSRGLVRLVRY